MNVDDVLQSAAGNHHFNNQGPQRPAQAHMTSARSPSLLLNRRAGAGSAEQPTSFAPWNNPTPSQRQRFGPSGFGGSQHGSGSHSIGAEHVLHPTPLRQPLRSMDAISGLFNGYPRDVGISGRAKVGRSGGMSGNRAPGPGAKHSGSAFLGMR